MKFLLALIIFVTSFPVFPHIEVDHKTEDTSTIMVEDYSILKKDSAPLDNTPVVGYPSNIGEGFSNYDDYGEFDTFLEAYYRGLTNNFGYNAFGSCSFIASGMLLSYYDTYLSDVFIPENYDVNSFSYGTNKIDERESPGVVFDDPRASLEATGGNFDFKNYNLEQCLQIYEFFSESNNTFTTPSLHAKLILMANDLGFFNSSTYSVKKEKYLLGTRLDQIKSLLEDYFEEQNLDETVTIDYYCPASDTEEQRSELVKQYVKNKIDLGKPVYVAAKGTYFDGSAYNEIDHAFICYDYDENYIYGHMGWGNDDIHDYTYYPVELLFTHYKGAMTLDTTISHSHTNNYVVFNSPATSYCYDSCYILTYKELPHSHSGVFVEFTADGHYDSCAFCGTKLFHSTHSYIVDDYSFICNEHGHQYNCAICNGFPIYEEEHDFMPNYVEYYDDGHYGVCLTSMQLRWMRYHNYQYAYTEGGYDYFYCDCGWYYRTPTPTG